MNNDFFQVLHNVMNRPSVYYYYLLSIFLYLLFPSLKLAFLGFLKLYAVWKLLLYSKWCSNTTLSLQQLALSLGLDVAQLLVKAFRKNMLPSRNITILL